MESFLQNFFSWLPQGWLYYSLLFSVTLLESIVMVGLLVPGSTLIVFAGFLAAHGRGDLVTIILVSVAGALAGDLVSYLLGARTGARIRYSRLFKKRSHLFRKGELFFVSRGGQSLFFGRFMGPLRGMVPFIAGCTHMPLGPFLVYTLISSALWGLAYPGLGFLGAASWQKIQQLTGHLSLLIGSLLVLFIINGLFWKKLFPRLVNRFMSFWPRIVSWWETLLETRPVKGFASRYPGLWAFLAGRFSLKRGSGLYLTVGFTISALFSLLFVQVVENILFLRTFDKQIYQLISHYRHPVADHFLIMVTSLADFPILLLMSGLIFLWLVLNNRDFSAAMLLVGIGGGQFLTALLKNIYTRARPQPFIMDLTNTLYSFPSGHTLSALVLGGLLIYFLLDTASKWRYRLGLIIGASFLALVIGLSRCYLGLNWFSDVLAGYFLGAIWLTFLFTVLEIRRRYAGEFPWGTGWQPVKLSRGLRRMILIPVFCLVIFLILHYLYERAF
jgi:membrane protein DedA with SNARE-associated domain/membrane-associated phospholipid phosphatase